MGPRPHPLLSLLLTPCLTHPWDLPTEPTQRPPCRVVGGPAQPPQRHREICLGRMRAEPSGRVGPQPRLLFCRATSLELSKAAEPWTCAGQCGLMVRAAVCAGS